MGGAGTETKGNDQCPSHKSRHGCFQVLIKRNPSGYGQRGRTGARTFPTSPASLTSRKDPGSPAMRPATYLVFGDLHGRVLPAFRLAQAWSREHGVVLDGLLQVGDLGYYPDPGRFDKATRRHAERDALECGAGLVAEPSEEADSVFADERCPGGLW